MRAMEGFSFHLEAANKRLSELGGKISTTVGS